MNKEVVKLSDEEVIKRCDFLIQDFCDNGFTSGEWHMSIPARPNLGADLVFSTLIHRFQEMLKELEAVKKERDELKTLVVWIEDNIYRHSKVMQKCREIMLKIRSNQNE